MCFTGLFEGSARLTSYRTTTLICTLSAISWSIITVLVFPNYSHQTLIDTTGGPFLPVGDWVVYVLAVAGGLTITWMGVLTMVAQGKVSRDLETMHGFPSDVLFSWTMIVWSVGNAAVFAVTSYVSLQLFCGMFLAGAVANHIVFCRDVLPYIREKSEV